MLNFVLANWHKSRKASLYLNIKVTYINAFHGLRLSIVTLPGRSAVVQIVHNVTYVDSFSGVWVSLNSVYNYHME